MNDRIVQHLTPKQSSWRRVVAVLCVVLCMAGCATNQSQTLLQQGRHYYHKGQYHAAFEHIGRSAMMGNANAQYALAYLYYYGKGTPQDFIMGKAWMHEAAEKGQPQAQRALFKLQQAQRLWRQQQPTLITPAGPSALPIYRDATVSHLKRSHQHATTQRPLKLPTPSN